MSLMNQFQSVFFSKCKKENPQTSDFRNQHYFTFSSHSSLFQLLSGLHLKFLQTPPTSHFIILIRYTKVWLCDNNVCEQKLFFSTAEPERPAVWRKRARWGCAYPSVFTHPQQYTPPLHHSLVALSAAVPYLYKSGHHTSLFIPQQLPLIPSHILILKSCILKKNCRADITLYKVVISHVSSEWLGVKWIGFDMNPGSGSGSRAL